MKCFSITSVAHKIMMLLIICVVLVSISIIYFYYLLIVNFQSLEKNTFHEFQYIRKLIEHKFYSYQASVKNIFHHFLNEKDFVVYNEDNFIDDEFFPDYIAVLDIKENKIKRFKVNNNFKNTFFTFIHDIQNYNQNNFNVSSIVPIMDHTNAHVADIYYEISISRIIDLISNIIGNDINFWIIKHNQEIAYSFKNKKKITSMYKDFCIDFPLLFSVYTLKLCKPQLDLLIGTTGILCVSIIITMLMIFWIMRFIYKNVCVSLIKISKLEKIDHGSCNIVEVNDIVKMISSYIDQVNSFKQHNNCTKTLSGTKSEFLSCITHELRNPLNVIINFNELIQKQDKKNQYIEYTTIIHKNADQLLCLVDNIIEVANVRLGVSCINKSNIDLTKLIKDVVLSNIEFIQEKDLKIQYNCDENLPKVFVDSDKIRKALNNVICNAIKFNILNGFIFIKSYYNIEDDVVAISIKDSGIGIEKEQIKNIFKDFNQLNSKLSRQFPGIGIGLFLAKKFVQMNNGVIKIFSELGKGTEIIIEFSAMK